MHCNTIRLYSATSKPSDSTSSGNLVHSHNCPASLKSTSLRMCSLKTVSRKAESFFCTSCLLSAGGESEGVGGAALEVFGPNYTFKASCVYDYSHRSRTKAETFQEFSEEDGFIRREDRDLHHNPIYMDPSELKPGHYGSSGHTDAFMCLTKHCTKIWKCITVIFY